MELILILRTQETKIFLNEHYTINFEMIQIDCSKGETDSTSILYIQKNNFSFNEASVILTIKQKMLNEEWNDIGTYTKQDIQFWITVLEKEYKHSTYNENVTGKEFLNDHFMHRLQFEADMLS